MAGDHRQLRDAGVHVQECDVCHVDQLNDLIGNAVRQTGRLDVLVNNAGIGLVAQIDQVAEQDWDRVIDTNLKAAFFGCRAAIAVMNQQETGGSIVNIASNAGLLPRSHDPVYSISKMALIGLTKSLALCHSKDRIRINAVCPGPVERTRIIEENFVNQPDRQRMLRKMIAASPLANAWDRMITPEEVAETVLYLCSDAARMVSGTSIAIDGGKSLGVPPAMNT
ncbi:MAG: SDR family oxidoreductase [Planctomycetaceae bacterium]|nr:SDR family oxidoreductase [Planctomycetaceae bacterium]